MIRPELDRASPVAGGFEARLAPMLAGACGTAHRLVFRSRLHRGCRLLQQPLPGVARECRIQFPVVEE